MLRFEHPDSFWLFLSLLVIAGVLYYSHNRNLRQIQRLGDVRLVKAMMPGQSKLQKRIQTVLGILALSTGIVALANLQAGSRTEKVERKGVDVMIALDVSKSMLAEDVKPNRLERAKQLITRLTEKLENDRIGLIVFAGRPYLSVPLTIDHSALRMNLAVASPDLVPTQGTVIGEALRMGREAFNQKERKFKNIIVISDGEDHDDTAMEEVNNAAEEGIVIHTLGIGSPEGTLLVEPGTRNPKLDENGNQIVSKLNETLLQDIADKGNGTYQRLSNPDAVAGNLIQQLRSAEQKNFGEVLFMDYKSYFQYFLIISLALILIEWLIPDRKKMIPA